MENMYIIYSGNFTELPTNDEKVLYVGEGEKYMDGLKELGFDIDKIFYTRGCMDKEGIQYFDFGSWTKFVALGTKEQLGRYLQKEKNRNE